MKMKNFLLCFCLFFLQAVSVFALESSSPKPPLSAEALYGKERLRRGESRVIEQMFTSIDLQGKKALEIGSRLGSIAFYLAQKYDMRITGLEGEEPLIAEAKQRTPHTLTDKVNFLPFSLPFCTGSDGPFPCGSFDLIYSKMTSWNVLNQSDMIAECHKLLKAEGTLVISQLLFSDPFQKKSQELLTSDSFSKLKLLKTETEYRELLKQNGFKIILLKDESKRYYKYYQKALKVLSAKKQALVSSYGEEEFNACLEQYVGAIHGLKTGDLRVLSFTGTKTAVIDTNSGK
jgi:cyclopropane fatty-acyl-phospholipid synthase-like methyltransferase